MDDLIHSLERKIIICAKRSTVFRYFTDSRRFADWWGEGSSIEGRVGGILRIRYPNGVLASGEILEIDPPERIVFTYGYESGKPIPPGASRITIILREHPDGTELILTHELSDPAVRDEHVQGWRYQLALFANIASRDQHSGIQAQVDSYFDIWNTADAGERRNKIDVNFDQDATFQDQYSCTFGLEDLNAHLSATHHFMPGLKMLREGDAKECQGTVLARWIVTKTDGSQVAKGTNVFRLSPEGKFRRVIGFWE